MREQWDYIPGFQRYIASNLGRVARLLVLSYRQEIDAYKHVALQGINGKHKTMLVHRIIAETFLGERPSDMTINHKNGNKLDNRVQNLEYVTSSDNRKHAYDVLGTKAAFGENHGNSKLLISDVREIKYLYSTGGWTQKQLADRYHVTRSTISGITTGKQWQNIEATNGIVYEQSSFEVQGLYVSDANWTINQLYPTYVIFENGYIAALIDGSRWASGGERYTRHTLSYLANKSRKILTHQLIAWTFLGMQPKDYIVNHKDGDTLNNRLDNLEYITKSGNRRHSIDVLGETFHKGTAIKNAKLNDDLVRAIREEYASKSHTRKALAELYNVARSTIDSILAWKTWKHVK